MYRVMGMHAPAPAVPSPYSAAVALSIDADGCTTERLRLVMRYWASTEATEFGPGLGLPIAGSMFMYSRNPSAPPHAAYLDGDREALLDACRRGWIDSLHSLGDFGPGLVCTREMAARAFDALDRDGVRIRIWSNHGGPQNTHNLLRPDSSGDVPGSPSYLSDLAVRYGIRYLWISELTHVVGQERAVTPGEYYRTYPGRPRLVRFASRILHPVSHQIVRKLRVEPFQGNALVYPARLRDGRPILAFRRFGRWRYDTISRLPWILDSDTLDRLVDTGGAMIVYLHIGPSADETAENFRAGMQSLRALAERFRERAIWVAKTSDLLDRFAAAREPAARPPLSGSPR